MPVVYTPSGSESSSRLRRAGSLGAPTSVAALALPIATSQAVRTGMLLSFLGYARAEIRVFIARSPSRAWLGLDIAMPLALAAWSASAGLTGNRAL